MSQKRQLQSRKRPVGASRFRTDLSNQCLSRPVAEPINGASKATCSTPRVCWHPFLRRNQHLRPTPLFSIAASAAALINAIKEYPFLYHKQSSHLNERSKENSAWQQICANFDARVHSDLLIVLSCTVPKDAGQRNGSVFMWRQRRVCISGTTKMKKQ